MIRINDKNISLKHKPFIIAELSGNHNQSLDRALELVDAAAMSGADALKLQTYTADTLTLDINNSEFKITDKNSLWKNKNLYSLYSNAFTPWDWHETIIKRCKELDIICFSTPYDETAVDFLETLDIPMYKIASFENTHIPLIRKVASIGKPIIISTGMATISDLDELVTAIRQEGCNKFILLKCTSTYPADPEYSNILTIPHMRDLFKCEVGLSDHTLGFGVSMAAIAHGATVIEKHLTINRDDGGVDSKFSSEPHELKILVEESEKAWDSLGKIYYGPTDKEKQSTKFRRSIYTTKNIKKGEVISPHNIRIIRPGYGLAPKYYNLLIGRRFNRNLKRGSAMDWSYVN